MSKECINSDKTAPAIGPYSHCVKANGFIFVSGQCPFKADGSGALQGPIEDQARLVLENLKAVLESAGSSLDKVVKTTMFLQDFNDFKTVNGIYAEYFPSNPPARTSIQIARLPLDVLIEIEAIALA
ncbi:MAG: reactive intermediate/imine deaminase [Candidatus Hydrogenedens sp.]|nr:reactive intermediate/imine deaminase [Candidatus Hydrogenedens sp.]